MGTPVTPNLRPGHAIFLAGLGIAFVSLLALASCKQSEGEKCQVDTDCEEGLICVPGISLCQKPGGSTGQADAAPRPDANTSVDDAATPDATPVDADVVDADVPDAAPNT